MPIDDDDGGPKHLIQAPPRALDHLNGPAPSAPSASHRLSVTDVVMGTFAIAVGVLLFPLFASSAWFWGTYAVVVPLAWWSARRVRRKKKPRPKPELPRAIARSAKQLSPHEPSKREL